MIKLLKNEYLPGYFYVLISVVGFSIKSIFIKLAYSYNVQPVTLLTLRMCLSIPLFMLVILFIGFYSKIKLGETKLVSLKLIIIASLCYYLTTLTDMYGLFYVSVMVERMILFTFPCFVVFFSIMFFKKTYSKMVITPFAISYSGLAIYFFANSGVGDGMSNDLVGVLLIFGSAIFYAVYFIVCEKSLKKTNPILFNSWSMLFAGFYALMQYFSSYNQVGLLLEQTWQVYILALFMAVFSTVIPSIFMVLGMKRIGVVPSALMNNLGPIITLVISVVILDDSISYMELIGILLVIFGIYSFRRFK
ncbi:DMT family transporter [Cysteiniphilum sp. 6C5]|uniref:DMT family transporter n=1 Tax=unclassified Cysteiniphilum TaxID=2610889 RepID=UPI003F83A050